MSVTASVTSRGEPAPPQTEGARKHVDFLDGMRALAALYVVFHHIWLQVWPRELGRTPPESVLQYTAWLSYGHFAVTLFLVLSGFCLMLPVVRGNGTLRGGAKAFLIRRARRILPPYYAAMAFSLALIWTLVGHKTGTHWDVSIPVTWKGFFIHVLLLQNLIPSDEINHVFWSIAVEWQIYFFFPVLLLLWGRMNPWAITIATALGAFGFAAACGHYHVPIIAPHYLALFVIGMFAAAMSHSADPAIRAWRDRTPWGLLSAIFAAAVVALCGHFGLDQSRFGIIDFVIGAFAACTLVYLSSERPNLLARALSWRPIVLIGGFSYSIYLIHAPLIQVAWQYTVAPLHLVATQAFLLTMAVSVPIVLGSAYLFYLVAERPFTSTVKRQ
jgi:peptidoglycan/LPS O-acetylase OafA/YrhL